MFSEINKTVSRRFFHEVFGKGNSNTLITGPPVDQAALHGLLKSA